LTAIKAAPGCRVYIGMQLRAKEKSHAARDNMHRGAGYLQR
jgi:hypothetical protein